MSQAAVEPVFALASQHHQAGRFQEAEKLYRQVLAEQPNHPGAILHLGILAHQVGRNDLAIGLIRQSISLDPNIPEAYNNLGNSLHDTGRLDDAISAYRQAIALRPDYAEAHYNLGVALKNAGRVNEAIAAYRRTLVLMPDSGEAYNNLGVALKDAGQLEEALAAFRQAVRLRPNSGEAYNNLGTALKDTGQPIDDVIAAFREAIALNPDMAEAHNNLGSALKDIGQLDDALAAYRRAMTLNPSLRPPRHNYLYTLCFHRDYPPAAILAGLRHWNDIFVRPAAARTLGPDHDRSPDRRLCIGYVSSDFCSHCQNLFTIPLLSHHNHESFKIFCYASVRQPDAYTQRIAGYADVWRDVRQMNDANVCDLIRADRIDILVDLTLHMADTRLPIFAHKPAPVQVTWLGYPGTTGIDAIDYRLTDPYLDPPGLDDAVYSEQSVRLPHTFWCYDPLTDEPPVTPPPCRRNGFITFGCLNNFCKINDAVLSLWADVLKANADSRLLCLAPEGICRQTMLHRLAALGVDAARVEFASKRDRPAYLRLYEQIDIGLDTFPYNGHTTSLDSYWMGVPVITLAGQTVVGRAGVSQLTNLRLTDLIARTPADYVRIATELAADRPRLAELRATLRERMRNSPLMDAPRFARDIEAAYRDMWRKWTA
jgi:protein O-GlcNAc transferase